MPHPSANRLSRRRFLSAAAAATTLSVAAPSVLTASKTDSKPIVGDRRLSV